ncbi:hypothetical protein Leryth_012514 [Lithospermum erythrorhizon]|nr:hypothetical protein Leryth_012514 [Lithospermum erythrorhizon]
MVHAFSSHPNGDSICSIPLGIGLFACVTCLVALCARHARRKISRKHMNETSYPNITHFVNKNKEAAKTKSSKDQEIIEEGGLWQKAILMGGKCQPLEFSGVIYYDPNGNRVPELPRTPKMPRRSSSLSDFISIQV